MESVRISIMYYIIINNILHELYVDSAYVCVEIIN